MGTNEGDYWEQVRNACNEQDSALGSDELASQVYWYLTKTHHQLSWASIYEVSVALQVDSVDNPQHNTIWPHEYHRLACVKGLLISLNKFDGKLWDVRVNFRGMDDAVRLQPNLTRSVRSVPALAWIRRIYEYMILERAAHSDEVGVEVEELLRIPSLVQPKTLYTPTNKTPSE